MVLDLYSTCMYNNIYNIHAVYKPDTKVSLFITFCKIMIFTDLHFLLHAYVTLFIFIFGKYLTMSIELIVGFAICKEILV